MNTRFCTTIEQSKKLLELGLHPATADMFWDLLDGDEPEEKIPCCLPDRFDISEGEFVPAWSFNALMRLMPTIDNEFPQVLRCNNYVGKWYGTTKRFGKYADERLTDALETFQYDNPIDPAFDMLCWLLEEKMIITEKSKE